jgi:phosphate starvation-inducible protein PhoH
MGKSKSSSTPRKKRNDTFEMNEESLNVREKNTITGMIKESFTLTAKNDSQKKLIRSIKENQITICNGHAGSGKTLVSVYMALSLLLDENNHYHKIALVKSMTVLKGEEIGFLKGPQPYYEKVLTPNGWTKMENIKEGDYVISIDGKKTKVINTYEAGLKDIYRVTLKDNRYVDCCLDHIWNVNTKKLDFMNLDTHFIMKHLKNEDFYLPVPKPIEFENNNDLNVDPYVLGVLIGDGSLTSGHVRFSSIDNEIIEKVKNICNIKYNLNYTKNNISHTLTTNRKESRKGSKQIKLTNLETNEIYYGFLKDIKKIVNEKDSIIIKRCIKKLSINNYKYEYTDIIKVIINPLKEHLINLNLIGKKSYEKFIPENYLFSSINDRIELLRGLLDTDGTIKKNGEIVYTTTSEILANNIIDLVLSLSGSARKYKREQKLSPQIFNDVKIYQRRPIYTIYIKFFDNNFNPFFLSRKANRFKILKTDSFKIKSIEPLNLKEKMKCIKIENPSSLYITKDFIVTHNTLTEKVDPYLESFKGNAKKLFSMTNIDALFDSSIIKFYPLAYIRGINLDNTIVICDETQNISIENMRTLLTRIGSNSKIISLGDTNQIDLRNKWESSLTLLMKIFENTKDVGCITMDINDENCRNPIVKIIEQKFKEYGENSNFIDKKVLHG